MKNILLILVALIGNTIFAQDISILTQRYNNYRTGWNTSEKELNTNNVNSSQFGLSFTRSVDDQMYATPLLVANLNISGKTQNVLFVVTMSNSVYAFNADDSSSMAALWHVNVTSTGNTVFKSSYLPCSNYGPNIGIIGTPAIDTISKTMYFISNEYKTATTKAQQYFHALDITTGLEKAGSPTLISSYVLGKGSASKNDTVYFDPIKHNQRSAMLLSNGVVYACWASFCDKDPYHGWVMGFDASTYKLKYTYNATPNGSEGGIWMAGNGPSVDDNGNIYIIVGNGTVGDSIHPNNPIGRGESLLKFKPTTDSLKLIDFFTPGNYAYLETNDLDYGNGTAMLIPNSNLSVSTSKEGKLFLLDDTQLGKYTANDDSVIQEFSVIPHYNFPQWANYGTPVYYHYYSQADSECVYVWGSFDSLKQIFFNRPTMKFDFSKTIVGKTTAAQSNYGPVLSVSSNDTVVGTGIVWALRFTTNTNGTGLLEAYDARDIRRLLWSSSKKSSDKLGVYPKFNSAVVANGKVYVPSMSNKIYVYGLHKLIGTSIKTENIDMVLSTFPNPATSSITLKYTLTKQVTDLKVSIVDVYGRTILTTTFNPIFGENAQVIQFNNKLNNGMYSVILRSNNDILGITKLVKY